MRARAALLSHLRRFLDGRGVMEVAPPVLGRCTVTAPNIESIEARAPRLAGNTPLFLQTSPEYAMKRMLAAGCGPIYAIVPAFRDGEAGRQHNPEFTLLEWYRPGYRLADLMDEVQQLVDPLLRPTGWTRLSYGGALRTHLGVDVLGLADEDLACLCREQGMQDTGGLERDGMLDLLFSHAVQPRLGSGAVFIHAYPASQAALARIDPGPPPVALRFELIVDGVEIANGYQELTDAAEQRLRFEADRALRRAHGQVEHAPDQRLLDALEAGLPCCSGVALGVDRLLMLKLGFDDLRDTLAFPFERL
jgi:lysyl-tRNA synthetase class 2